jgi:hypothetical protein
MPPTADQVRSYVKSSMCGQMDPERFISKYSSHRTTGDQLFLDYYLSHIKANPERHERFLDHINSVTVILPREAAEDEDVFISEPAQRPEMLVPPAIEEIKPDGTGGALKSYIARSTAPVKSAGDSDSDSGSGSDSEEEDVDITPEEFDRESIQSIRLQVKQSEAVVAALQARNPSNFFAYKANQKRIAQWAQVLRVY